MAATTVQILPGPACLHCKGGQVINGVPCDDCSASGRQGVPRRRWRRLLRSRPALAAATAAGTVVSWSRTVPGIAGAAGFTYGVAAVVHGVFGQVPELGVVAVVGGVFGLLADRRL